MCIIRESISGEVPHLKRYAVSLTRDRAVAEDLVQDCVETAIKRAKQYEPEMALRRWLFAILRNTYFNQRRRRQRLPFVEEGFAEGQLPAMSSNQEANVALGEVQSKLDCLPPEHRDVLVIVVVEGSTYEEAAAALGVATGTVRSRLARARLTLRRELGHEPPAFGGDTEAAAEAGGGRLS